MYCHWSCALEVGPGFEQGLDHGRTLVAGGRLMQGREVCLVPRFQVGPGAQASSHVLDPRRLEILLGVPLLAIRRPKHWVRKCETGNQRRNPDCHAFLPPPKIRVFPFACDRFSTLGNGACRMTAFPKSALPR